MNSTLFLIPTSLSNTIDHHIIQHKRLNNIKHLKYFIVETLKIARQHLKQLDLIHPIQDLILMELNKHTASNEIEHILTILKSNDVGLLSDCGMPAIADPGAQIVALAHKHNIQVKPLSGDSSLLITLMSSGFSGQNFAFNGYLSIDKNICKKQLFELQELILNKKQTQIIIETPFRNQQLLINIITSLNERLSLCVGINLMNDNEQIISKQLTWWQNQFKQNQLINLHKQEVVFVIGESFL